MRRYAEFSSKGATMDPVAVLRKRLETTTMRALARELGVSAPYISDIVAGRRTPGPKVLDPLGMEAVTTTKRIYRRKR